MSIFNLMAKITLDSSEYKKQLGEAAKETGSFGSKIKSGLKVAAGAVMAGVTATGTAVVALGKQAVNAYANYEQLVGGVETLFKDSADVVLGYADNAYKTAGLSANQYMETVTSFSASLLQSLNGDTNAAAEYANTAITDMADNANKMGTAMESIQNAYQGFAKQNYTMLDNLKLGYGGTASEMYRLLEDAAKIDKKFAETAEFSLSTTGHLEAGYADIVQAIHIVQNEMGITGTTAKEASSTIQGSIASAKGAWQNLLTGLTDENADLNKLMSNMLDSLGTAAKNLIPRLSKILTGVSALISGVLPQLAAEIPRILNELLPGLITGATCLLNSLVQALPSILSSLTPAVPQLLTGIEQIFYSLIASFPDLMKILIDALPVLIPQVVTALVNMTVLLIEHTSEILQPVIDALPSIIEAILVAVFSNLPQLVVGCIRLIGSLFSAILQVLDGLLSMVFDPVFKWLGNVFSKAWTAVSGFFADIWDAVSEAFSKAANWVYDTIIKPVADFFKGLWEGIVSVFHTVIDPWIEIIKRASKIVYDKIVKPVLDYFKNLWEDIKEIWNKVSSWFKEHVTEPVKKLFTGIWESIKEKAADAWEGIKNAFKPIADWFHDVFSDAWSKVKDVFSTGGKVFDGIKEGIENTFKTVVNAIIRGINKVITIPFKAINDILKKIHDIEILGVSPFNWVHTFKVPEIPQLAKGGIAKRPVIAGEAGAEAIIPLENNTEWIQKVANEINASTNSAKLMQQMLEELRTMRQDIGGIILSALRTNSDDFNVSEKDMARLVKKYAFA